MAAPAGIAPRFTRWLTTPHRENPPRTACVPCAGGGDINGLPCQDCGGRGWFDDANPAPKTGK